MKTSRKDIPLLRVLFNRRDEQTVKFRISVLELFKIV